MSVARLAVVASALATLPSVADAAWETRDVAGLDTRVYVPATQSPVGSGRALLVALHGCTQSADQLQDFGNFELAAETFGVVIALPNVPNGGVLAGCWDYYGAAHSRDAGHAGSVVAATEALRDDPGLGIDPAQIYVAGLSSGAGEALVLGCVAPDLFAGVVASAGPAVGTTSAQIATVGTTAAQAQTVCQTLAGSFASSFDTQLGIAFTDTADYIVAQGYAQLDAEVFDLLFSGGAMQTAPVDVTAMEGSSPTGDALAYADGTGPRALWISSTSGTGHAWPAGSGELSTGLSFVSGAGINLSYVAAKFFADNSRRAEGGPPPGSDDSGGGSGDGDGSADDGSAGDSSADDGSTPTTGGDDGSAGTNADDDGDSSGCGCTTTRPGAVVPWAVFALLGLVVRRRDP